MNRLSSEIRHEFFEAQRRPGAPASEETCPLPARPHCTVSDVLRLPPTRRRIVRARGA